MEWSFKTFLFNGLFVFYAVCNLEGEHFDGKNIGKEFDSQKSNMKLRSQSKAYPYTYQQAVLPIVTKHKYAQDS